MDSTERLYFHFSLSCIGEGNGNPLQCSCLENPRGRAAWWAAIPGVAQSRTRLKWLSCSKILLGLSWWLSRKEYTCNAGTTEDAGSIPGSGRSYGGGHNNPLQYSFLENPMNRRSWWATVHRVTKSQTCLKLLNVHTGTRSY